MTPSSPRHLWLALSPHGFGHAAMTAPVVAELRRRHPDLRLTIQTTVPRSFLESRYGTDFTHIADIPDFGLRMVSAVEVDFDASARGYAELHADWPGVVEREAERLRAARPDLVLANIPYVTVAAAALAGIPVVALSSLQWADIYRHYLGDRPESGRIFRQMVEAYDRAAVFLQVTPAMAMPSLGRLRRIGPVGAKGRARPEELRRAVGGAEDGRIGLIAFGGIDHTLDLGRWPVLPGWRWLSTLDCPPDRPDIQPWRCAGLAYADVAASVDAIVTKPGYGTFVEAALAGIPVLFTARPDWPECPHLDNWLISNGIGLAAEPEDLLGEGLAPLLRKLFSMKKQRIAEASGNAEAADILEKLLEAAPQICE